jgi:hypothetical protein
VRNYGVRDLHNANVTAATILDVRPCPALTDRLRGARVNIPRAGTTSHGHVIELAGWVVASEAIVRSVEVVFQGVTLRTLPLDVVREDVAEYLGIELRHATVGFWSGVSLVGLPHQFELTLRAVHADGSTEDIATIKGEREGVRTRAESQINPLLVTSLGRTGTTLLMRLLAAHREIAVAGTYPFETRAASYWLHMVRVLSEPANYLESTHRDTFQSDLWHVGHHPDYLIQQPKVPVEFFSLPYVEDLATFARETIEKFYLSCDVGGVRPAYFAEKFTPGLVPNLAWEIFSDPKEIFLVRDWRDMIASVFAFNAKRGTQGFGRSEVATDEEYIYWIAESVSQLCESWHARRDRALLLRYEDMIADPTNVLTKVREYLQLRDDTDVERVISQVNAGDPDLVDHRTTADAQASVGRWMSDLPAHLHEPARDALTPLLREFGYAP